MKKIAKLLFSKITIGLLAIFIQVAFWLVLYSVLGHLTPVINTFIGVVSTLLLLVIINKKEADVFKLPWIVVILLFPLFGTIIYAIFGRNPLSNKRRYFQLDIKRKIEQSFVQNPSTIDKLKEESLDAYGKSHYIYQTSFLPVYQNTTCEFLSSGEVYLEKLLEYLNKAKEYVMLEFFILAEGEMLDSILEVLYKKVQEGVKVYLLFDDIGSIGRIKKKKVNEIKNNGIEVVRFNPFIPIASVIHNNRDHRKIVVIDGKYGFIGGINIGDEYINKEVRFGKWKDSALLLKGEAVNSLVGIFLQNYNIFVKKEKRLNYEDCKSSYQEENDGFVHPFCDGPFPFDEYHIGEEVYLNLINSAKKEILITTPYLIVSYEFIQSLIRASLRGVKVKIITPHIPDKKLTNILTKSNYESLIKNGVEIYEYQPGFIHAKNFIVDEEYAVCGTINLDYRSFVHHYECAVFIYQSKAVLDMKKDFVNIIENEGLQIDEERSKLSFIKRIIKGIMNLFSPLF